MYKKINSKFIEDINSNVTIYEHKKTHAKVMTIENDDPNKVFSIAFRTPPINNSGLTHILEHSVLCGSKKFPLKDPFVELLKGSLNTFLNAFTFPDKTMYPCASLNDKDFRNLMHVYLDAVFYPNIYSNPFIFKQEGWHYELEDKNDDIKINGVVYNEMKGAYSDPMGVMGRYIMHSLFPDNCYGLESGGDPKFIPDLSYEDFKNFHSKYYSPSNAYIMIYGNCDMQDTLKFIEDEYLNNFDYNDFNTKIAYSNHNTLTKEEYYYNVSKKMPKSDFLSYNIALPNNLDIKKNIALDILVEVLFQNPGAPIREALIKSGIAEDIDVSIEFDLLQPFLSIVAINSNAKDEDKFISIIEDSLKHVTLDKEAILASLNFREFKTREAKADGPKGLGFMIKALESWLYDDNMPYQALESLKYYDELRNALDTNYFNDLIFECILNNNHKSYVKLLPKEGLLEEEASVLSERLKVYKESLGDDEIENLILETKKLKEYQETPDTKEVIDTLPKLKLSDLSKEPLKMNIEAIDNLPFKAFYSNYFTNNIAYIDYLFDISDFDIKTLQYTKLLGGLYDLINTKNHSYLELTKLIKMHTGGFTTPIRFIERISGDIKIYFDLKGSSLGNKINILNDIEKDTIFNSLFEEDRLTEVLNELKTSLEQSVPGSGHVIAATRAASYKSKCYMISDAIGGIAYLDFIEEIASLKNKGEVIENLKRVEKLIFNKKRMVLDFTSDEELKDLVINAAMDIYNSLGDDESILDGADKPENLCEAIETSYDVNYMGQYGHYTEAFNGDLYVLRNAISLDYLWQNVRVLGGAYGSMIRITDSGHILLASYRDPNTKRTLDIFDSIADFIENLHPTADELLKYKIGAIGALDDSYHVSTIGGMAFNNLVSGRTYNLLRQRRIEIINAKVDDLHKYAQMFRDALSDKAISGLISKTSLNNVEDIFENKRELIRK